MPYNDKFKYFQSELIRNRETVSLIQLFDSLHLPNKNSDVMLGFDQTNVNRKMTECLPPIHL